MGLRTVLFVAIFLVCSCGALAVPLLGLLGYVAHYVIGPDRQWWAAPLQQYDIRYSLTLAAMAAIGIAISSQKLRFGPTLLSAQEKLLLTFLGMLWLLRALSEPTALYTVVDHPTVKLTKVVVFCLMLTHVVTEAKNLKILIVTLVGSTLLLGLQAYTAPRWMFQFGRLEGIGGVDFSESNFLPAFFGGILPLMGIMFLESGWWGKLLALAAGLFSVNAIVLTRSRGALVGIGLGVIATIALAPKGHRGKILAGLAVAALGGLYLVDEGFRERASTVTRSEDERDRSAESRLEIWRLGGAILRDHPMGIGPGNFFQVVGRYDPMHEGRDAHNTYVRCFTELGAAGFLLFLGLIGHATVVAMRTMKKAYALPPEHRNAILLSSYGFTVGLVTMLGCGLTVTLLYTEVLWWFLMIPVCIERAADNLAADLAAQEMALAEESRDVGEPILA